MIMKKMTCLIAGLPDSGKSTYLGALWYVTQSASGKIELALRASNENMPENTSLLEGLSRKWHNVEDMDRTSNDAPENISFLMCPMGSDDELSIEVPDFRGESIRQIITENQPSEFDDWCSKAENLLFFVSDVRAGIYADDFEDDEDETDAAEKMSEEDKTDETPPVLELEPKNITPAAQNMLILRYLYENYWFKKIVICLTAWDKVIKKNGGNPKDPEEYLMEQSPALYNFITFHFEHVKYFGLSAQGDEYNYVAKGEDDTKNKRVTDECKKRLQKLTRECKRAFVFDGVTKSYDITLPIAEFLKQG